MIPSALLQLGQPPAPGTSPSEVPSTGPLRGTFPPPWSLSYRYPFPREATRCAVFDQYLRWLAEREGIPL